MQAHFGERSIDVRNMRSTIWGVFLIALGSLLLLERMGAVHLPEGTLWPSILFVIAIAHLAQRRFGAALMFVLLGTIFLACTLGWYGMSYARSWPLLIVVAGVGIVLRALTGESCCRIRGEVEHE